MIAYDYVTDLKIANRRIVGEEKSIKLASDAEEFFDGQETASVGYAIYGEAVNKSDHVNGATAWHSVQNADQYYMSLEEKLVLSQVIKDVKNSALYTRNFVDLGTGDYQAINTKTLPLIQSLQANRYIAYDVNQHYLDKAKKIISKQGIFVRTNEFDFFNSDLPKQEKHSILSLIGGTIGNLSLGGNTFLGLSLLLTRFRRSVSFGSYFLISFDSNQNKYELNHSYQECAPIRRLFEDVLWRIQRDTSFDFNPQLFEYKGIWHPHEHRYAHYVEAKEDCTVVSGSGRSWLIRQGQRLHVQNSYKFPVSVMERAAENAGWKTKKIWTETGRVHYILLEAV